VEKITYRLLELIFIGGQFGTVLKFEDVVEEILALYDIDGDC
jgi:hypothetical protein